MSMTIWPISLAQTSHLSSQPHKTNCLFNTLLWIVWRNFKLNMSKIELLLFPPVLLVAVISAVSGSLLTGRLYFFVLFKFGMITMICFGHGMWAEVTYITSKHKFKSCYKISPKSFLFQRNHHFRWWRHHQLSFLNEYALSYMKWTCSVNEKRTTDFFYRFFEIYFTFHKINQWFSVYNYQNIILEHFQYL